MRLHVVIFILLFPLLSLSQFNNMDAEFIRSNNITAIKASYIESEDIPEYQIFYLFDSTGRIVESSTSDDIVTNYFYDDSLNLSIQTRVNKDIGNKMVTYTIGWKKIAVKIYNAHGDSLIHRLFYDTLKTEDGVYIECYDILLGEQDTAFRQVFDLKGNLLLYEVFGYYGEVVAYYTYKYENNNLVYTEFYEEGYFVYKEVISYQEDSNIRKKRISVPGETMFSDIENSYTTDYYIDKSGLLVQESDFIGKNLTSVIVYTYQFYVPKKSKK